MPAGAVELTEEMQAHFHEVLLSNAISDAYSNAIAQWTSEATVEYSAEAKAIMGITE